MDPLSQDIAQAAQTVERVIESARRERDRQGFGKLLPSEHSAALQTMRRTYWVDPHQPIAWPSWPPGVRAKVVAVWHKVMRRLLRWYIYPLAHQQQEFNQAALTVIQQLTQEVLDLRASRLREHDEFQAQLDALAAQVGNLQQHRQEEPH